jgi:hypothetical protein
MIQPGIYNIKLQRRADYSIQLRFLDSNKSAINLTGWSVYSQIWDAARTTKYAQFSVNYLDRSQGTVKLALSAASTESMPDQAIYDVLLIDTEGLKEYYLEGGITVEQGYTTAP